MLTAAALGVVVVVAWLDAFMEPKFSVSLLYLVPIALLAWYVGAVPGLLVAAAAVTAWFAQEFFRHGFGGAAVETWNIGTRLIVFCSFAFFISTIRKDRNKLVQLNDRQRQVLAQEAQDARKDQLTGLFNWRGFEEMLQRAISRSSRNHLPLCVAYMDIDNFKKVNDLFGHSEGNNVLKRIGTAIMETVRSDDLKARVGGDEFAFVFNCHQVSIAEALGKRLVAKIGSIGLEYPGTRLGASLGIAFFPHAPDRQDGILRTADDLMFQAKAAGKGTLVVSVIDPQANRKSLLT